jgi:hypothetical protein
MKEQNGFTLEVHAARHRKDRGYIERDEFSDFEDLFPDLADDFNSDIIYPTFEAAKEALVTLIREHPAVSFEDKYTGDKCVISIDGTIYPNLWDDNTFEGYDYPMFSRCNVDNAGIEKILFA